jgi:hypothetical protein
MVFRSAMLDRIRKNTRAAARLAEVFDFDVIRLEPVEPVWLASGGKLRACCATKTATNTTPL